MELRLVYEQLQGDYDDVIGRLLTEDRVKKYLFKFMDSPTMSLLLEALEKEDFEVAFRESHNLKGISANLGLSKLYTSSSELTESLRHGKPSEDISGLIEAVKCDYELTINALKNI